MSHIRFDYSEITEHIFLGTNFCCKLHFDEEHLKKAKLKKNPVVRGG